MAAITDVLNEVTPATGEAKTANVMTDEIEEKDVAIQMLNVFIDEVPELCYQYIDQISRILLSLTDYLANDSIRSNSAQCLPGLMQAAKKAGVEPATLHEMARTYNANIYKAMEKELDTDTLIVQV